MLKPALATIFALLCALCMAQDPNTMVHVRVIDQNLLIDSPFGGKLNLNGQDLLALYQQLKDGIAAQSARNTAMQARIVALEQVQMFSCMT